MIGFSGSKGMQDQTTKYTPKTAVVLQGGGARGAYQVGALRAIGEITGQRRSPFAIVCGASVGAINAAPLAAAALDFQQGTRHLEQLWRSLTSSSIYDTRTLTLLATGARWAWTLVFSHLGVGAPCAFLDATPLAKLLEREFDQRHIVQASDCGALHALCITAASFDEGIAVTFFQGHESIAEWARARRSGRRTKIRPEHLLASASLPFAFAPVLINGCYYGDGAMRLTSPLSPAIHTGADRILVIAARDRLPPGPPSTVSQNRPTMGAMAGHALDILFNDNLEADHERLSRVNDTLSLLSPDARQKTPLRKIETLMLSPSEDLRRIGQRFARDVPLAIRLLMHSFGTWGDDGRLVSYLLFEPRYISALIDLGYADTMARSEEIRTFLKA